MATHTAFASGATSRGPIASNSELSLARASFIRVRGPSMSWRAHHLIGLSWGPCGISDIFDEADDEGFDFFGGLGSCLRGLMLHGGDEKAVDFHPGLVGRFFILQLGG